MKTIVILLLIVAALAVVFGFRNRISPERRSEMISETPHSFYELKYKDINGKEVRMADYKGKYVLLVNVASKCGNTPQYAELQELYDKYKEKLVIVGFPCNQFGRQEPGKDEEIQEFCSKNYGVTFALASKVDVKGSDQHPVYTWLTNKESNGVGSDEVEWNFHKFLVSPEGKWLASYKAGLDPMSPEIVGMIK